MRIFISHAAADRPIAERLADLVRGLISDAETFLASRPGTIATGAEWWPQVQAELRSADRYIVLLTPTSAARPWVLFETGAGWMTARPLLTLCARALDRSSLPEPLRFLQVSSLEEPSELEHAFDPWGLAVPDAHPVSVSFREIAAGLETAPIEGWGGLEYQGRYFAWDHPSLSSFPDLDPEPTPSGLPDTLRARGFNPRYAVPNRLESHFERGYKRVFETDRRSWRRALIGVGGEQILLVAPAAASPAA